MKWAQLYGSLNILWHCLFALCVCTMTVRGIFSSYFSDDILKKCGKFLWQILYSKPFKVIPFVFLFLFFFFFFLVFLIFPVFLSVCQLLVHSSLRCQHFPSQYFVHKLHSYEVFSSFVFLHWNLSGPTFFHFTYSLPKTLFTLEWYSVFSRVSCFIFNFMRWRAWVCGYL